MPRRRCRFVVSLIVLLALVVPAPETLAAARKAANRPESAARTAEPARPIESPGHQDGPLDRNVAALQRSLNQLARMDAEQWELLEALLSLDDEGWMMLKQILAMPHEDLDRLVRTMEADAGILGSIVDRSDPGSPDAPTLPGNTPEGEPPTAAPFGLKEVYNQIAAKVDAARSRIDGVRSRIDTLLPDQADVRGLFSRIPLSNVTRLIDDIKESFGNVIDTLDTLREGFESFNDAQMKQDLTAFLDDLEELVRVPQELACFDDPEATITDIDTDLVRRLINVLPKVALLAMDKMLTAFAPDWRTSLRDVIAGIPMDLREGVCTSSAASFSDEAPFAEHEGTVLLRNQWHATKPAASTVDQLVECSKLRQAEILGDLLKVRINLKRFGTLFDSISEYLKEDVTVELSIVAIGGGGAGTNVQVPVKPLLKTIKNVLELLNWRIETLISRRESCLADDDQLERDLLACTPLAEYAIDILRPRELAQRRVEELEDAGVATSSEVQDVENATTFSELCEAYRSILMD